MKPRGRGTKGSGKFTGLGIAQQFANAVCHFLRQHRRAKTSERRGGKELPLNENVWRAVLRMEYNPEARKTAQSLEAYCGYYNGATKGHGYDKDGIWDCGTGKRSGKQRVGDSILKKNRDKTVHPGTSPPYLTPREVIAIVRRRSGEIPTKQGRKAAERLKPQWRSLEKAGEFDPSDDRDARRRIQAAIVRRYGSQRFRDALLEAYEGRCAVTGCNVPAALEAAHIKPYNGQKTDYVTNGLLLRGDIHTLFDLNFLGIEPDSLKITLAYSLDDSSYKKYNGRVIGTPSDDTLRPNRQALQRKWKEFQTAGGTTH